MRQTVVITGSSGLLGEALAERLGPDFTVVGLDVVAPSEDAPIDLSLHFDVTSDMSVRDALDRIRMEYGRNLAAVVHLAAYYDFGGDPSPLYDEVTVEGTRRLLRHLRKQDFALDRFVFTSTMLVHGPVKPGERIDEDSPLDARWPYPESKLETEGVIREERGDYPSALLRIAGVYTDHGGQPTLVQQIKRIHSQDFNSFFFPGDTEAGQAIVHLDDAVDAIVRTVERRRDLPEEAEILIGEPDPMSYAELQDEIGEHLWGAEWPTIRVPEGMAKAGAWVQDRVPGGDSFIKPYMIELADDHYALDISRARELLGWEPRHDFREELPGILDQVRENPEEWYERNGLEMPEDAVGAFD